MADTTVAPTNQLIRYRGGKAVKEPAAEGPGEDEAMGRANDLARKGLISGDQLAKTKAKFKKVKKAKPPGDESDDAVEDRSGSDGDSDGSEGGKMPVTRVTVETGESQPKKGI